MDPFVITSAAPVKKGLSRNFKIILGMLFALLIVGTIYFLMNNSPKPKTYSVVSFDTNKVQLISEGATLTGKGLPDSNVTILITPGNLKKDIKTSSEGSWSYNLANSSPGDHHLTIQIWDKKQSLAAIKSYRIKIVRKSIFSIFKLSKIFSVNTVYAQSCQEEKDPNYPKWSLQMRKLGIYPVCENDEIILYSEAEYDKNYCPAPCAKLERQRSLSDQIRGHLSSNNSPFIKELVNKLYQKGYAPLIILTTYIPELSDPNLQKELGLSQAQAYALNSKKTISDATLKAMLSEVYQEHFNYLYKGESLGELIDLAGLRTIINVFTDPQHHNLLYLDSDESLDFLVGLSMIYGPAKLAVNVGEGSIKMSVSALRNIRSLRSALKAGEKVPLKVLEAEDFQAAYIARRAAIVAGGAKGDMPQYLGKVASWGDILPSQNLTSEVITSLRALQLNPVFKSQASAEVFENFLKPGLEKGFVSAASLDEVVAPASQKLFATLNAFFEQIGARRNIVELNSVSYYGKVYVVDDELAKLWWSASTNGQSLFAQNGFAGVTVGDLIMITRRYYESSYGIATLFHELVHTVAGPGNLGRFYGSSEPGKKALSLIFEIGTDAWVNKLMGEEIAPKVGKLGQGAYITTDKATSKAIFDRIVPTLNKQGDNGINALLDFAVTADADQFLFKVTGKTGAEGEAKLLEVIRKAGIDINRLVYLKQIGKGAFIGTGIGEVGGLMYLSMKYDISQNLRNFVQNLPIFKQNKFEQEVDTMFTNSIVSPPFDSSSNIMTNDYDPNSGFDALGDIHIISAEGEAIPGGVIETNTIIDEFGQTVENNSEYVQTWTIKPKHTGMGGLLPIKNAQAMESSEDLPGSVSQVKPLSGGEACSGQCKVTIPKDIAPGEYELIVYLSEKGSDKILNADSYPLTIKKAAKKVIKINFNNQELDLNNPILPAHLPGVVGQAQEFDVPLIIEYSDGITKYLSYHINYQAKVEKSSPTENQAPGIQDCSPGDYKRTCTRACGGCAENAGEATVEQCKPDGSGYESRGSECSTDCAGPCRQIPSDTQSAPSQDSTSQETACWINADPNNRQASNDICGQNHEGATRCDQYDTGPWGDGCVI